MEGTLYLCPTPIGNLGDITERVKEVLSEVHFIAAEDTRHSGQLLKGYGIKKPLISYQKFNEAERSEEIVARLLKGESAALISDAGMPGISDPGEVLVKKCLDAGIRVSALPGPSAVIAALAMSGLPTRRFAFEGFLPTGKKEREMVLSDIESRTYTTVLYEAPHHLKKTMELLSARMPSRQMALIREISKIHEETRRGSAESLSRELDAQPPRGEYVLVIAGRDSEEAEKAARAAYAELSLEEHMALYSDLPEKEAMKKVAADRGVKKSDIYAKLKTGASGSGLRR